MLFIDDFQWADADSLALLRELMHPPGAPSLLLVATLRTGVAQISNDPIEASIGGLRRIHVEPLSPAEGQELARLLTNGNDVADRVAIETAGHPMFIQELVRHLAATGGHAAGSLRLDDALWDRVLKLDPPDRTLLEVLAVAGAPITQDVAAAAAGMELADLITRVTPLRTANLVRTGGSRGADPIDPYHDRIREAVLARLSDETRTRYHLELAQALESAGAADADPRALMRHFQGAGDTRRAAQYAERAARLAESALAFDQAAELLKVALTLGQHTEAERSRLHLQLGDALANCGHGREAADAYLAALPGADAGPRLDAQRRAAEQLLISGHINLGLQTLAAVLTEVGVRLPPSRRSALRSLLVQRVKIRLRGLRWTRHDASEIAPRDLFRLDVYKAVAMGLALVDNIRGADFQARGLLLALDLGEPQRVGRSFALEAIYQGTRGPKTRKRVEQHLTELRQVANATGDRMLTGWVHAATGLVSFLRGEFKLAARELGDCIETFRELPGTACETSNSYVLRLLSIRFMGSFRELRTEYDRYVRDAARRGDRFAETTLTRTCNQVWLVDDDPARAKRELDSKSWAPPEGGYHMQHYYEARAHVELAMYTGTVAAQSNELLAGFDGLDDSLLLRIQTVRSDYQWLMARHALATGQRRKAARMARKLTKEGVPYACIWADLIRAALDRDLDLLRALPKRAEALDMLICAAVARMRLAELLGDTAEASALRAHALEWMAAKNVKNSE